MICLAELHSCSGQELVNASIRAGGFDKGQRLTLNMERLCSRQCPDCGGDWLWPGVLMSREHDSMPAPSNYWRCSICGGEFTAEQLRENKRSKPFEVARPLGQPLVNTAERGQQAPHEMSDEGCPNESPRVEDATGYSIEHEEGESMAEEASESATGKHSTVKDGTNNPKLETYSH
jgi:hypothetical protein